MQLKLPFRLTRGAVVVLVIVFVHVVLAVLFIEMRVQAPELGPVFATLLPDSEDADRKLGASAKHSASRRKTPLPPAAPAAPSSCVQLRCATSTRPSQASA